jgi:Putative adhesin
MLDKTFPVAGPLELRCEFRSGSLTVHAREELAEARVTIRSRAADLSIDGLFRVELTGDRLEVVEQSDQGSFLQAVLGGDLRSFTRDRMFGRTEVDIVVELPAGSTTKVTAMSAAVTSTGRIGTTAVNSGASSVELDLVDGELKLHGGSGSVTVNRLTGSGQVRGGSGRIRIGEIAGALSVSVGSGEVEVGQAHGPVRIRSGSGSTVIGAAEQDVDIASSSGPVSIGLRPGRPARLDVATGSGRLNTEMPVQDSAPAGRAITIRARTGSGDITVRRAAAVAG